jgi:hypothetical protein
VGTLRPTCLSRGGRFRLEFEHKKAGDREVPRWVNFGIAWWRFVFSEPAGSVVGLEVGVGRRTVLSNVEAVDFFFFVDSDTHDGFQSSENYEGEDKGEQ